MTANDTQQPSLAELAETDSLTADQQAWLVAHPEEAAEVAAARQMRELLLQLRSLSVDVPEGLEARISSKVHRTTAVRELLNLNLSGSARALVELMTLLFSFFPAASQEEPPAPRSA